MILWAITTVVIAVAASAFTLSIMRRHDARLQLGRAEALRSQLGEIDEQVVCGAIGADVAETLDTKVTKPVLAALRRPASRIATQWLVLGGVAVLILTSVGLYVIFRTPAPPRIESSDAGARPGIQADPHAGADIGMLIHQLELKMREHPGDPEGWRVLGWSYMQTGRAADAATAYARAVALDPKNANYASAEGEALTESAGGQVTPAALGAFHRALAADGSDPRARFFIAMSKDQRGDHAGAVADWSSLLKFGPANAPWRAQVLSVLRRTARRYNIAIPGTLEPPAHTAQASPGANPSPAPTQDQVAAASRISVNDRQAMIYGMVERLAAELKENPHNEGGWVRLMRARMVLGESTAATIAYRDACKAFAGQPSELAAVQAAARDLGVPGV